MLRVLVAVGLAVLALAALAGAAAWLAYGTAPPREGTLALDGLRAPVTVAWSDTAGVTVEAETLVDLAAGLGYAHAADHAWPMAWLRQNARGTTAEWFGDSLRTRDLHARRLGFDAVARATYAALPPADRALFDAYARGVNRALAEPGVAQSDPFVLLAIAPEPWQPWDAIAVERLIAWTGTDAPGADSAWAAARAASPAARAFARADSAFRADVGLDGMRHGRVFAAPSSEGPTLVQHHAIGTTADAVFVPAVLRVAGRSTAALTVPGTLLLPGGRTSGGAWGLLLTSRATVAPLTGRLPPPVYSRIVERDGDERLVAARRDSTGLAIGRRPPAGPRAPVRPDTTATAPDTTAPSRTAPAAPLTTAPPLASDTTLARADTSVTGFWRIDWAGFGMGTDAAALFRVAGGQALPALQVFSGTGLAVTASGEPRVLGTPVVTVTGDTFTLVSDAPAARAAAARLAALAPYRPWPTTLATDAVSVPAATTLRPLLAGLGNRDSLATALQEPYSYLASWDGGYTADAIGGTLFAAWLDAHESITGRRPDPADSLDRALLPYTLRLARAELRDRHGPNPADWRWGAFQGGPQHPVLGTRRGPAARAYQLADAGGGGHPLALRPGPSPDGGAGPAVWTAWVSLRDGTLFVRAPRRPRVTDADVETASEVIGRTTAVDLETDAPGVRLTLRPRASAS